MPVQTGCPPTSVNFSTGIDHSYELQDQYIQDGLPSFQFRKRSGEINWRKLCCLDVEKVARELDFITLQENISTVTFCNIDSIGDLDPLFVKLFKLSQFTIEYLLHSQEYLQSIVNDYEAKLEDSTKANGSLQKTVEELQADVLKLKDENKKRRKMIQQQQMLIEAGASSYYQCPHCEKAFMNASFLQAHMQRRHPGCVNYIGDVIAHSQNAQAKLAKQLRVLEGDLQTERETFNAKLLKAEEEKRLWTEQSQRDMDEWKTKETARMKEQLDTMKQSFFEEVSQLKEKEMTYQEQIADLQETMNVRQTNLGELVDDLEDEKQKLKGYEDRVLTLEQLNEFKDQQIDDLNGTVKYLRSDASLRLQQEELLLDQERRMKELQEQLKHMPTNERITRIQREIERLTIENDSSEDVSMMDVMVDGRDRASQIRAMKPQIIKHLRSLLDDKLRNSGVDPEARGISTTTLGRKLTVLKTERQMTAKEIPSYYQIRENSRRAVTAEAAKLSKFNRATKKSAGKTSSRNVSFKPSDDKSRSSSPPSKSPSMHSRGYRSPPRSKTSLSRKSSVETIPKEPSREPSRGSVNSRAKRKKKREASPPTPKKSDTRTSSAPPKDSKPPTATTPATQMKSLEEKMAESFSSERPTAATPSKDSKRPTASTTPIKSLEAKMAESFLTESEMSIARDDGKGSNPTPVPRGAQRMKQSSSPVNSENDDVSDWDDVSEILADDYVPAPKRKTNVKELTKKLEKDLYTPKKKPPAGAVQVLPRRETVVEEFKMPDSDDDLFSVTSSEDDSRVRKGQRPGTSSLPPSGGLRRSAASNSSNTYGTSVWGSGQKVTNDDDLDEFDLDDIEEIK